MARVSAVYVVSEVVGLSSQVQKLLPCVNVVNIDITTVREEQTGKVILFKGGLFLQKSRIWYLGLFVKKKKKKKKKK